MRTIALTLQENKGIGPGFDFLRLLLAFLILFWHSFVVSYGISWSIQVLHGPYRIFIFFLVPAFFALSGFLVAGSMLRLKRRLHVFLLFRVLRIVPALTMETVLSACFLGAWATTLPLNAYFSSPGFFAYMLNILGFMHFTLPGVFAANPWPEYVNFSLWTIPAELSCYILVAVLMLAGIVEERGLLLGAFVVVTCALALKEPPGFRPYSTSVIFSHPMLISCFAAGNLFYLWKDRIPLNLTLLALSIVGLAIAVYGVYSLCFFLGALSIAYITIYLGLSRLPNIASLIRGDYSYGVYLYAYPIQQTIVWLFPSLREFYFVFLMSAPLALLFAALSWHLVEKRALLLRKYFLSTAHVAGDN